MANNFLRRDIHQQLPQIMATALLLVVSIVNKIYHHVARMHMSLVHACIYNAWMHAHASMHLSCMDVCIHAYIMHVCISMRMHPCIYHACMRVHACMLRCIFVYKCSWLLYRGSLREVSADGDRSSQARGVCRQEHVERTQLEFRAVLLLRRFCSHDHRFVRQQSIAIPTK